jgi:hypothetical protein
MYRGAGICRGAEILLEETRDLLLPNLGINFQQKEPFLQEGRGHNTIRLEFSNTMYNLKSWNRK